jgi:membrane-bound serine protease (ClpP class)
MRTARSLAITAAAILGMAGGALAGPALPAVAQGSSPVVIGLGLDGVVDPFVASYVEDGIRDAEADEAAAVLLTIDTPGGLDSSMRRIVQAILNTRVPVICYVSPEGARAASAGAFILLACPIAAMAPATNVGAAHPVGVSGAIQSEKVENDAAGFIVSLADRRGRNAEWAERAVRESESASAEEALRLGVIDLIAVDVPDLFAQVEGETVEVAGGETVTLQLAGATIEERQLGWGVGFLHELLDPNVAFIFFYLGLALLFAELFVPGLVLGTIGVIMLVLAVVSLGMLPVQIIGVVLLIASLVLFILELKIPGVGLATVGGVITLILGGLFLFDPAVPSARVSPWVIAPVAVFAALFFTVVIQAAIRLRHRPSAWRGTEVVGEVGTVVREIAPVGVIQVAFEEWTAESGSGPLPVGTRVRVVKKQGLRLVVEPVDVADAMVDPAAPAVPGSPVPEGGKT